VSFRQQCNDQSNETVKHWQHAIEDLRRDVLFCLYCSRTLAESFGLSVNCCFKSGIFFNTHHNLPPDSIAILLSWATSGRQPHDEQCHVTTPIQTDGHGAEQTCSGHTFPARRRFRWKEPNEDHDDRSDLFIKWGWRFETQEESSSE